MDKSIPYEIIVVFSIQRAVFVTEGFGTHKCVPYENDRALSYISYLNQINAPFLFVPQRIKAEYDLPRPRAFHTRQRISQIP